MKNSVYPGSFVSSSLSPSTRAAEKPFVPDGAARIEPAGRRESPGRAALRRYALALAAGLILMVFSEMMFWGRWKAGDTPGGYALTWLAYSFLAYAFLSAVHISRARSPWALFLCGALYGWLAEGVIVHTLYANLPVQISITGLSWHALFSVWLGWVGLRQALHRGRPGRVLWLAAAIGAAWGVWSLTWWVEEPGAVAPVVAYALYALGATGLLLAGYWAHGRLARQGFRPARWELAIVAGLFVAYFALVTVPAAPVALAVLPPLLLILGLSLWRNRRVERRPSLFDEPAPPVRPLALVGLLALPLAATAVYAVAWSLGLRWWTGAPIFALSGLAGALLFIAAVIRVWTTPRKA